MASGNHKSRGGWHELREGAQFTLARHWPARLDVQASAAFPHALRGRLARQIRQDMWRELRGLRGFSPVILIATTDEGMTVTAGGQFMVSGAVPKTLSDKIQSLLDSPVHRARWLKWAKRRTA